MSDPIHHLRVLHNNPFIFSSAFAVFFDALGKKERTFLLGYLLLPMTLHLPSREYLQKANSRSSLRSMLKDRTRIQGLEERVTRYHGMTSTTVQYLLDAGGVSVHDQLSVSVTERQVMDGPSPEGVIRAARRLGILFRPYDAPMVFRILGVMSL